MQARLRFLFSHGSKNIIVKRKDFKVPLQNFVSEERLKGSFMTKCFEECISSVSRSSHDFHYQMNSHTIPAGKCQKFRQESQNLKKKVKIRVLKINTKVQKQTFERGFSIKDNQINFSSKPIYL